MDTKALRQKVLDLAIRGKLVPQDPNDEPAEALLERIRAEKQQMVKDGKLKAKDLKGNSVIFRGEDNLHYEKMPDGTVKCIENEIPFEVPEGWVWTRLGDIFFLQAGKFIRAADIKEKMFLNSHLCYGGNGVRGYVAKWNKFGEHPIIGRQGALCGNVQYASGHFYATEHAIAVDCFSNTNSLWAFYFLRELNLNQYATATAQPGLAVSKITDVLIPLPPITEQHRIVKAISSAFAQIDILETEKADLQSIIAQAKSKILDLAIRGKLVPQDPTDEPASVLLERIRAEKESLIKQGKIKREKNESCIFRGDDKSYYHTVGKNMHIAPYEIPVSWAWASLEQINNFQGNQKIPSSQPTSLFELYSVPIYETRYPEIVRGETIGSSKQVVEKGDVLLCKINPRINRVWYVTAFTKNQTLASSEWIVIRNSNMDIMYLHWALQSSYFRELLLSNVSGVGGSLMRAQPSSVKKYVIPIPPTSEQHRIVAAIEDAFTQLDSILTALV